jgi:antitoxin CptB
MNTESSLSAEETARLRYRCRRGLLELDTLFTRFIDSPRFTQLSPLQRQTFELLLDEPDPQLLSWLLGQERCEKAAFRELIERIRG